MTPPASAQRGCELIGPFIEMESLVLLSEIGAVAGDLLVVLLVVRVRSVSVTQDPNANRHTQTRQTPMDFFISTVYRKQIHRASKQAIAATTTFSMSNFVGWK